MDRQSPVRFDFHGHAGSSVFSPAVWVVGVE
jgi:hypothetical protein